MGERRALRLGFNQVKGLSEDRWRQFVARRDAGYGSVDDVMRRAGLDRKSLERLAEADAFRSLGLDRRQALWAMKGVEIAPPALFAALGRRRRATCRRRCRRCRSASTSSRIITGPACR